MKRPAVENAASKASDEQDNVMQQQTEAEAMDVDDAETMNSADEVA